LLSEAGYFHSISMDEDALWVKDICDANGVKCSGLSAHCPLMRPEISVPYLEKAIRFAEVLGAPVVNTDEGIRPSWLTDSERFEVMRYTLKTLLRTAAPRHTGGFADAARQLGHRQCIPWRGRSLCGPGSRCRSGGSRSRQGYLRGIRRG